MLKIRVVKAMLRVTAVAAISLLVALSASAQTVRYVHTDGLGSVVLTTDKDRNIIERTEYEPYGNLLNRPVTDGPGYTGHVMDAATGLTYMQQRYYDPVLGKFLSVDPVTAYDSKDWRFFGRYTYAFDNPYKFKDLDGRCPLACPNDISNAPTIEQTADILGWTSEGLDKADEFFSALGPYGMPERAMAGPIMVGARAAVVEAKIAAAAARVNKINHIFGKPEHNLSGLVKTFGGEAKALRAIEKATTKAVDTSANGKFETVVKVGGKDVTVRGAVVDGKVKIGTAFIPPPPVPVPRAN